MANKIHFFCKTHSFIYETLGGCPYCKKENLEKLHKKSEEYFNTDSAVIKNNTTKNK